MRRYHIMIATLVFFGAVAFILPPRLMKWKDEQTADISYVEKTEEISLVSQVALSLTEKMELFQRKTSNTLWIAKGKNYDQESIQSKVLEELQKLCDLGILEINLDELEFNAIEGGGVVDTADSTQTMSIWTIYACHVDNAYDMLIVLDDETGKIFSIRQSSELFGVVSSSNVMVDWEGTDVKVKEYSSSTKELWNIAEKWAKYLELEMAVAEYSEGRLLCMVEDEKGAAAYLIRKDVNHIMLGINLTM